jgi:hypothetical protein
MPAKKWISPMIRGRGLQTINALPPSVPKRISLLGKRFEPPKRMPHRRLTGPAWFVPGFEQLAWIKPTRG